MTSIQIGKASSFAPTDLASPPTNSSSIAPIELVDRLAALDVLRGFAMVMIIFANIQWFSTARPYPTAIDSSLGGLDFSTSWLIMIFIDTNMYRLFCVLFGMGIAVMITRLTSNNRPYMAILFKRFTILLLFGVFNEVFLWDGDALHCWAITGFLFLIWLMLIKTKPLRFLSNHNAFLHIGLVVIILSFLIPLTKTFMVGFTNDHLELNASWQKAQAVTQQVELIRHKEQENQSTNLLQNSVDEQLARFTDDERSGIKLSAQTRYDREQNQAQRLSRTNDIYGGDSYWLSMKHRAEKFVYYDLLSFGYLKYYLTDVLPLFFLGYWLIASRIFTNNKKHLTFFRVTTGIGVTVGLFLCITGLSIYTHPAGETATEIRTLAWQIFSFGKFFIVVGYIGLFVLLSQLKYGQLWIRHFAPIGRMALTNYLMQMLVLSLIFYGYAGGWYGKLSLSQQMPIALGLWIFQAIFSSWWLKRFYFGPVEWLWRSLTYGKIQKFRFNDKFLEQN